MGSLVFFSVEQTLSHWFQYVYGTPKKMIAAWLLHLKKVLSLRFFTERLYKASNIFM